MRNAYIVLIITTLVFLAFVVGDYFAVYGTSDSARIDYLELNFKTVDEETGAPVVEAHARCFQQNNRNACSEANSVKPGIVSIRVPLHKIVTRSYMFEQGVKLLDTADPRLHIMFIHYDYAHPVETYEINELPALAGKTITVTMPKPLSRD